MQDKRRLAGCIAAARIGGLLALLALCSCQSIPSPEAAVTATRQSPPMNAAQPRPPANVRAAYPVQRAAHNHPVGQPCPCCGPGTLPAFAFTGFGPDEAGMQWQPDAIKGPW